MGHFGTPEGEQEDGPEGGATVKFQRGVIFWSPNTGAHFITSGALLDAFNEAGGLAELGYPTDDLKDSADGKTIDFEKGKITDKDGDVEVSKN